MNPICATTAGLLALLLATSAGASEPGPAAIDFDAGRPIAGALSLNGSESGRDARRTPIFSKYRPTLVFGGREVICTIHLAHGVRTIAPGETGDVTLDCRNAVSVAPGTRVTVREGGKNVGHVLVRAPEAPASARP